MPRSSQAECANPLLLAWVKEWLDTARDRNSKGAPVYKNAYNSLKACPIPFTHPSEAQQLTGFGPQLCKRLTDKLKDYCEENGLDMPHMPQKQKKRKSKDVEEEEGNDEEPAPKKKTKKPKPYVPALRSGGYAILLALATLNENSSSGLTKPEIIELAEPFCNASFTAAEPNTYFTAWNSMKTLITKDLVCEKGRPTRRYMLTDEGWDTAKRIKKSSDPSQGRMDTFIAANNPAPASPNPNEDSFIDLDSPPRPNTRSVSEYPTKPSTAFDNVVPQGEIVSNISALPSFTPIILEPGSFTVELVLDVREIRAKTDRDYMKENLLTAGVKPIMRALELGDILWVAKLRDPTLLSRLGAEGDEVLLDYIVERKRLDDLVSSIKDGRFHEQKFRLKKSGVKNVIYIIEEITMSDSIQRYEEAVQSAIAGTQVVEGYFVKKTQKMDDTIRYLVSMTKLLKTRYENESLHLIPTNVITTGNYNPLVKHLRETQPTTEYHITYSAFASLSSKSETLTLRDIFLKMLMCTRGLTGEKALEIQRRWKTPSAFVEAYRKIDGVGALASGGGIGSKEKRKRKMELVSNEMGSLVGRKKVAKALSVKLAEVWGDVTLG